MENNLLIAAISAGITAVIGAIGAFIVSIRKQNSSDEQLSHDRAMKTYETLVQTLKKNHDDLQILYRDMEKGYIECREKCAECRAASQYFQKELEEALNKLKKYE